MLQKRTKFADAIRAQEIIMKADGRFVDKRLNMNVKVDADEAREKNERLMNIVKTKLALKKLKIMEPFLPINTIIAFILLCVVIYVGLNDNDKL